MSTKVTNEVKIPHDIVVLGSLKEGATFLYKGELAIFINSDPEIMFLGGPNHGHTEEFSYDETDSMTVMLVNCAITCSRIPAPRPKKAKKVAKKKAKK